MKELYFAPVVDFPTPSLGEAGRRTKELVGTIELSEWEKAYQEYWNLLEERVGSLPLKKGFHIYLQMTPTGMKLDKALAAIRRDGARGENPDHLVAGLVKQGGHLIPIDSNYITQKVLNVAEKMTKAVRQYDRYQLSVYADEYSDLMPAVGAYRASVINRTLRDGEQGILLEYGDTGRTLNFLKDDIIMNRIIDEEEYKKLTEKIPQAKHRF